MTSETISIAATEKSFTAHLVRPEGASKGALIVIHEIWGLNPHTKDVAERFAAQGYLTLAPDLLSGTEVDGKVDATITRRLQDPATRDEAQKEMRAALAPMQHPAFSQEVMTKLAACFAFLYAETEHIGVIGYCFGGTYSFARAVAEPRLKVALPYYGHAEQNVGELKKITCPVYAFYGEQDHGLVDALPNLEKRMQEAGVSFKATVYPNCGHAFFNDTNPNMYNQAAATDAWEQTLSLLHDCLS
jgi:carboxymethylenebutenolidase